MGSPFTANIKRLSLFGSYLHDTAGFDSDVDLLVEFKEPVGFFALSDMLHYFEEHLGKKVDLLTPNSLSKYFRDEVLAQAEQVYESR